MIYDSYGDIHTDASRNLMSQITVLSDSENTQHLHIILTIDCPSNSVTLEITYSEYTNNWFGIVSTMKCQAMH